MAKEKYVQDTHMSERVKALHGAMMRIMGVMVRPRNDEQMLKAAGVQLDRALFSVLISIERLGPIGVVELGERMGRDYTTLSRQVAKLESLGLIERRESEEDRRKREAVIAAKGRAMTKRIDAARARKAQEIFKDWSSAELDTFVQLMQRFADALERDSEKN
jgi:DNA-binding MarR family transcriptional regulator